MKIPFDKNLLIHQTIREIDIYILSLIDTYRRGKHNEEIETLEIVRRFLNRNREELVEVAYKNYRRSKQVGRMI